MSHARFLKIATSLLLFSGLISCGGQATVNETWSLVKLVSMGEPIDNDVSETIEVRNCIVPEAKTTECSAGTSSSLSVEFGGGVELGEGFSGSIDSSISSSLGIGRQNGQSISLEVPPSGYIYTYEVDKRFRVISGEVVAHSSSGKEQTVNYVFNASCSITIVSREQANCSGTGPDTGSSPTPPPDQPTIPPFPPSRPTDTSANTILNIGESWYLSGIELSLKDVTIQNIPTGPGCWDCGYPAPFLTFYVTNHTSQQVPLSYNLADDVSAVDNLGRRLKPGVTNMAPYDPLDTYSLFETKKIVLNSDEQIPLISWGDYPPPSVIILADASDSSLKEITVSVSIGNINNARWRISINP